MVAPSYAQKRSLLAKQIGLGVGAGKRHRTRRSRLCRRCSVCRSGDITGRGREAVGPAPPALHGHPFIRPTSSDLHGGSFQ